MDAKKLPGMVLSDIPGAEEDVETVCKDKSCVCDPQITQIFAEHRGQRAKSSKRSTDFADLRRFKDKEKHSAKDKEKLKVKQLENSRIRVLFIGEPINHSTI